MSAGSFPVSFYAELEQQAELLRAAPTGGTYTDVDLSEFSERAVEVLDAADYRDALTALVHARALDFVLDGCGLDWTADGTYRFADKLAQVVVAVIASQGAPLRDTLAVWAGRYIAEAAELITFANPAEDADPA